MKLCSFVGGYLKIGEICSSEGSINTYKTSHHHNPEDHNPPSMKISYLTVTEAANNNKLLCHNLHALNFITLTSENCTTAFNPFIISLSTHVLI
jgi:hypothetical protein